MTKGIDAGLVQRYLRDQQPGFGQLKRQSQILPGLRRPGDPAFIVQRHHQGQPLQQRGGRCVIPVQAFVQCHDGEAAGRLIQRRSHFGGQPRAHSFGHARDQHALIDLVQQPTLLHRPSSSEAQRQIEAAQQPVIVDLRGQTPPRRARRLSMLQGRQHVVACRAGRAAQMQAAQARRVHSQQPSGAGGVVVLRVVQVEAQRAHSSATARSIRSVEPVSSSGLRRSRWRSAGAAT